MSRAREVSKIVENLSSALENVVVDLTGYLTESNASATYLTISSASTTYATSESLGAIDVDNLPDDLMTMGG